jgi:hypothetical protein
MLMKKEPKPIDKDFRVVSSQPFKLKNRIGKHYQFINLMKLFGFIPDTIIVEKVLGQNNVIMVRAVIPKNKISEFDEKDLGKH